MENLFVITRQNLFENLFVRFAITRQSFHLFYFNTCTVHFQISTRQMLHGEGI
jgi:hypothetical protein